MDLQLGESPFVLWVATGAELTLVPASVAMNEVAPGRWFFMFAGIIDSEKILASDDSLKDALRSMTERNDLKFGDVVYTTDYRYVLLDAPQC